MARQAAGQPRPLRASRARCAFVLLCSQLPIPLFCSLRLLLWLNCPTAALSGSGRPPLTLLTARVALRSTHLGACWRHALHVRSAQTPLLCSASARALPPLSLPQALSEGELTAALYNIACCRSRLGDVENGLVAIAGAVEQGGSGGQRSMWCWCVKVWECVGG